MFLSGIKMNDIPAAVEEDDQDEEDQEPAADPEVRDQAVGGCVWKFPELNGGLFFVRKMMEP